MTPETAYWRGVIDGVAAFCRRHPHVRYLLPSPTEPMAEGYVMTDGVITIVADEASAARAARFGKPVVNVSSMGSDLPFPSVLTDNVAIGRLAAEHLLAQGYAAYACHMESRVAYSVERLHGFRERLKEAGKAVDVFDSSPECGSPSDPAGLRAATAAWLAGLRKPTGLLSHNDARACGILALCRDGGIRVPEEVGILGVDDDEFLDVSCRPTLSSVDNAPSLVGYRAAEMLALILAGGEASATVRVAPRRVVERQSTQAALTDDPLLTEAVRYIRRHATDPIGVDDVVREVALSRRSLERRFRQRLDRSPAEEILRVRVERAKGLLGDSDLPVSAVAEAVGYGQSRNFATAFQREVGMEPRAYRALYRIRGRS